MNIVDLSWNAKPSPVTVANEEFWGIHFIILVMIVTGWGAAQDLSVCVSWELEKCSSCLDIILLVS